MDRGRCVDFRDPKENARFEFRFGFDPDLPQEGMRHLPKEGLDQIKPGTVLGRVNVGETIRSSSQVCTRLFGDVRRMIVQNNPNRRFGGIVGVHVFEQGNELPAAMSLLDSGHDVAIVQIQGG